MALLDDAKNYLDITWETTPAEDRKLQSMINRGKAAITGRLGDCDFESDTQEKTLLLVYVMYERSGALDEFWRNYRGDIISLQMGKRAERYAAEKQDI